MKDTDQPILHKDGVSYVLPFILVTCCFALWGFANDITNPMVKAFSKIFRMSVTDGALVQVAFYGGYFAMAFPAAMFIRKYSYKAGILLGLGLYAVGALLFFPAKMTGSYYPFLLAYFILTCGLSFLETSSNVFMRVGPTMRFPLLTAWLIQYAAPKVNAVLLRWGILAYYLWAGMLVILMGGTFEQLLKPGEKDYQLEIFLALTGIAVCTANFILGKSIGSRFHRRIAGGQALAQKNIILPMWLTFQ